MGTRNVENTKDEENDNVDNGELGWGPSGKVFKRELLLLLLLISAIKGRVDWRVGGLILGGWGWGVGGRAGG